MILFIVLTNNKRCIFDFGLTICVSKLDLLSQHHTFICLNEVSNVVSAKKYK